ncbi:hypothetical protein SAMN05216266_10962 [Amycolatopsis marina]|uniref:Uncharacterized protein n=1 Tax=Amycolatopsis marina TaxID=490629 RepID=A0A1I1AIU5_9PSEU|nr:hypothetical protein [Amycolatopsis marina]SFB36370.1 hypothetical protein SAMN05216266_10962 [Amycolatopsis marina]
MSLRNRLLHLLRRRPEPVLELDSPGLAVVARSFDPAEADSAALARAGDNVTQIPAVLRHHLLLPADRVEEAARILAQDGWELRPATGTADEPDRADDPPELLRVHALRVQRLTALSCAQESSRMAGLAQRLAGDSLGWDALAPPTPN